MRNDLPGRSRQWQEALVLHNQQVPEACRAQHIPPLPEASLSLDLQPHLDIHVMNLLHGTQISDNNGTHWIAVFTMLNMASSVGQHTIRQMPHDYHNHHQSVSITLGSESTVVSLVLKPLIQRQFTYTEDSSEHKLLKTIKESWDFQKKYQTKNWCAYVRDFDRHQLINMDNVSTRERFYSFAHSYSLPRPSPQM